MKSFKFDDVEDPDSSWYKLSQREKWNDCPYGGKFSDAVMIDTYEKVPKYEYKEDAPKKESGGSTKDYKEQITIQYKQAQLAEKYQLEFDAITDLNNKALEYEQCNDKGKDFTKNVADYEKAIIADQKLQLDYSLYDGFWAVYDSEIDISSSGSVFTEIASTDMTEILGEAKRRLDVGDDQIMDEDPKPLETVIGIPNYTLYRPVGITTCTYTKSTLKGRLAGFQLFYQEFDKFAGSVHGNMGKDTKCSYKYIDGLVTNVDTYEDEAGQVSEAGLLEGMKLTIQNIDDASSKTSVISAGLVDQKQQTRRFISFLKNDVSGDNFFFGFKTDTDSDNAITEYSLVSYDPNELYLQQRKDDEDSVSGLRSTAATNNDLLVGIFENDRLARVKTPSSFANVAGVYRPEDQVRDQREIDKIVAQIQAQKAKDSESAAAAQAALDEALAQEEEDAASEAAAEGESGIEDTDAYKAHKDEDKDANAGAIAACVIGAILLFVLIGYCIMKMIMMSRQKEAGMNRSNSGTVRVLNNSYRSDGTPNQGKLDDIM